MIFAFSPRFYDTWSSNIQSNAPVISTCPKLFQIHLKTLKFCYLDLCTLTAEHRHIKKQQCFVSIFVTIMLRDIYNMAEIEPTIYHKRDLC